MSARKNKTEESAKQAEPVVDPASLALVAQETRHLLAFHLQLGIRSYPADPTLRQFLQQAQNLTARPVPAPSEQQRRQVSASAPSAHIGSESAAQQAPTRPAKIERLDHEEKQRQMEGLVRELARCRSCPSGAEHPALPGQGNLIPRLLVVGDWYSAADQQGAVWGKEEDEMLWKMMAAIGLDRASVYVTNAVKCPQQEPIRPDSAATQSCFAFLEQELQIIRPQLICTMGEIATRALLRTKAPVARLRGRFHPYRFPDGSRAKVMPTFHPRLLLQHPEMKRATWEDLQAIQRLL
ncbi:MAG: uracil-DNA glycosylase [Candidatus Electrothrix sp. YB6]